MPPRRLSNVVLPDPEGPITATKSPCEMAISRWSKIGIVSLPLTNFLVKATRRTMGVSGVNALSCGIFRVRSVRGCRFFGSHAGRRNLFEERDLHGHVGKNAQILVLHADAYLDGRLLAVGRGDDRDHRCRDGPVRIGVEHGVDIAARLHAAD